MAVFFFFFKFEKCYRKSCKYMRNNSTRQKGKRIQLTISISSRTVWRYVTKKGRKALKWKRRLTCGHGFRWICKLYRKGRPAGKLKWCKPFKYRDHLEYRWRDNIQRSTPQNTGRAKIVTTILQEKCFFRPTLGARTFYTFSLATESES